MNLKKLPYMLYADSDGRIYDHPYYRMAGSSGNDALIPVHQDDLVLMPEFSKLFYIPDCPPVGLDPVTGEYVVVGEIDIDGEVIQCFAVAAFLEPGFVRTHLPAVDYSPKSYILPMWGYAAVGFKNDAYYATGFRVEYNHKWDPRNYDDRDLVPAIDEFKKQFQSGPLVDHLTNCAVNNHCFAAKNLFLGRWEAPLPVSQVCNAACIGCLSLQVDKACSASHHRISFRPKKDEIVSLAVCHLEKATDAIVSFGQGCEGEPLTEYELIADSIMEIRKKTAKGTINLNTNGSWPERVREVAASGLDSIRISLNSAQPDLYRAYYRPKNYDFEDVVASIRLSREMGLYTMINYLVFPGVNDCLDEIAALEELINKTGVNFIHVKNLNIDPQQYMQEMPAIKSKAIGMRRMTEGIQEKFPDLVLGYFNQPVKSS
jgi:pyruvate-formate lyase-activating enzyme